MSKSEPYTSFTLLNLHEIKSGSILKVETKFKISRDEIFTHTLIRVGALWWKGLNVKLDFDYANMPKSNFKLGEMKFHAIISIGKHLYIPHTETYRKRNSEKFLDAGLISAIWLKV